MPGRAGTTSGAAVGSNARGSSRRPRHLGPSASAPLPRPRARRAAPRHAPPRAGASWLSSGRAGRSTRGPADGWHVGPPVGSRTSTGCQPPQTALGRFVDRLRGQVACPRAKPAQTGRMDPDNEFLSGTAYWTAAARARESSRADRLFNDPLAGVLSGELGARALAASELAAGGENPYLPIRTRWFDRAVDFHARTSARWSILVPGSMRARSGWHCRRSSAGSKSTCPRYSRRRSRPWRRWGRAFGSLSRQIFAVGGASPSSGPALRSAGRLYGWRKVCSSTCSLQPSTVSWRRPDSCPRPAAGLRPTSSELPCAGLETGVRGRLSAATTRCIYSAARAGPRWRQRN